MSLLRQVIHIVRVEAHFFSRYPRLLWATLFVAVLPALYAVIYLSSVWDPAANTGALPVALVNLDQGVHYRESRFNVGLEVATKLRSTHAFGFTDYADELQARRLVREGKLAFALIIPRDFSSNAIPGQEAGGGKLVVYTSEGNNFESAVIARHFAQELGHDVNESLNERRWQLVLASAAGSQRNVDLLHESVAQLSTGAHELATGAKQAASGSRSIAQGADRLSDKVDEFTQGFKQLSAGVKTMDARRPTNGELNRLRNGAEALASGQAELDKGFMELQSGSQRLRDGIATFRDDAKDSLLIPARVGDGLDQLSTGMVQLDTGLQTASESQKKLVDGATKLSTGVGTLTAGLRSMNSSIHTAAGKLPEDSQLNELGTGANTLAAGASQLAEGTQRLRSGTDRLTTGLELLASSLPARVDSVGGSAEGLANSVRPQVEIESPVANSGSGFAPNIIPAALWLGAGIAAFLIHVRVLPRSARLYARPAQIAGKMLIPAGIVLLQASLVFVTVRYALGIQISHPAAFALALAAASLTFLFIVFALTRAFGDAGKALAMVFLAIQLSSSGGVLPVELSGGLFADISPWLPLTWVVRTMKGTLFDAYGGAWQQPLALVAMAGFVAALSACYLGRWRFVRAASIRPAVDF